MSEIDVLWGVCVLASAIFAMRIVDREGPSLELQRPLVAGQQDVSRLVEKRANAAIAALGDAAGVINLA